MRYNLEFLMTPKEYKGIKQAFNDKKIYSMIRQYDLYEIGTIIIKFSLSVDSDLYVTMLKDKSVINREKSKINCFEKIENVYTTTWLNGEIITINLIEGFDNTAFKDIHDYNSHIFTKLRVKYEEAFYDDLKMFIAYSDFTKEINLISSLYIVVSYLINNDHSFVDIMKWRLEKIGFNTEDILNQKDSKETINKLLEIVDNLGSMNLDSVISLLLSMFEIYSSRLSEEEIKKNYPVLLNIDADSLFLGLKYTL